MAVPALRRPAALVSACLAVSALSLLAPWALAFDPQVWIAWGNDLFHLRLDTAGGPTWKPLSVLVTTLLAPFGQGAEALWLIVARTGGLLALAGAYVLARRLSNRLGGAVAVLAMALSPWWLLNTALGNSEGILAAAILWGIVAHLAGRLRATLALGAAAALLRPEIWPFLGLYVLWLWRRHPERRRDAVIAVLAIAAGWLLPDALGEDGLFAASSIARTGASPGSAQQEDEPALAVLRFAAEYVTVPALLAAIPAMANRTARVLAVGALAYVAIVVLLTAAGFAGNPRYLVPAVAVGSVVAGVGVARLGRAALPAAAAMAVALALTQAGHLERDVDSVRWRADQRTQLDVAIARAGGVRALNSCGEIHSGYYWRALVASRLDVRLEGIDRISDAPGALLRSPPLEGAALQPGRVGRGFTRRVAVPGWEVWTRCGPL